MNPRCKHCGQALPKPKRIRDVCFTPIQQRIYDHVLAASPANSVDVGKLVDLVYIDAPWCRGRSIADLDGGPLTAREAIWVQVARMNKILAQQGMRIRGTLGRGSKYRLEKL